MDGVDVGDGDGWMMALNSGRSGALLQRTAFASAIGPGLAKATDGLLSIIVLRLSFATLLGRGEI